MKFIDKKTIDSLNLIIDESVIDCKVKKDKEIFIDAHKMMYPCCHTGSVPSLYHTQSELQIVSKKMNDQHYDMINTLGELDTTKKSVKDIIESHEFQTSWDAYWTIKKLIICVRTCGVSEHIDFSRPRDQWKK
jgi:hypothetical protein